MKDNDVAYISEQFSLTKEIVEASVKDGTLGQRINDATKDQVVYKTQSDFDTFKTNFRAETTSTYFDELVEKAKKGDIPQGLYAPIKGSAYQQLERDVSKKYNIENYSDVNDLISQLVKTSANGKGDEVIKAENKELKLANIELLKKSEDAVKTVTDEFNTRFLNKEKDSILSGIPFDFSGVKTDELEKNKTNAQTLLKSVFDSKYILGYNDKNLVIVKDKEGKPLTNAATLEPIPAKDVFIGLAKEFSMKLTSPDGGGQGGSSSAQSSGLFSTYEEFLAHCKSNNINPMEKEGIDLWRKAGINKQ